VTKIKFKVWPYPWAVVRLPATHSSESVFLSTGLRKFGSQAFAVGLAVFFCVFIERAKTSFVTISFVMSRLTAAVDGVEHLQQVLSAFCVASFSSENS
jgi:hypothetical protein